MSEPGRRLLADGPARRRRRWRSALLLAGLLAPGAAAVPRSASRQPVLAGYYDLWLESVAQLAARRERAFFRSLSTDLDRELFIRAFWRERTSTLGDGVLQRWHERFAVARVRRDELGPARTRAILGAGKPERVFAFRACVGDLRPIEVWRYSAWQAAYQSGRLAEEGFDLLFYRQDLGQSRRWSHWSPEDGAGVLLTGVAAGPGVKGEQVAARAAVACPGVSRQAVDVLREALADALGREELLALVAPPLPPDYGWLHRLEAAVAAGSALPVAGLEVSFPGRYQQSTVVAGRMEIPGTAVERTADGDLFDRLEVEGDAYREGRFVESFRIVYYLAGRAPPGGVVPLTLYRRLWPGPWTLDLRAEDGRGVGLLRQRLHLEVPRREQEAEPPAGYRKGFAGLIRREVGVVVTFPSVELLPVGEQPLAGEVTVRVATAGGPIEGVEVRLDGRRAGVDDEAPFAVVVDLGRFPRRTRLEAVALDPSGRPLARDARQVNVGSSRFRVGIVEPRPGGPLDRARVAVEVPADQALERLELWLNGSRIATRSAPPFVFDLEGLVHQPPRPTDFLRAVAVLADGRRKEDTVMLAPEGPAERMDVRLVEVYASVRDPRGRPVTGLSRRDFRVFEDGEEQPIQRFASVQVLAVDVALLMDTSASMRSGVVVASRGARRFFEQLIGTGDHGSLFTFSDQIRRQVPFTGDLDRLRAATAGFHARGSTRLYDALTWALYSFGGRQGRRALVVLSDGRDVDSDYGAGQVLEAAVRAGVTVYPVLLSVGDVVTHSDLARIATATGGRMFSIGTVDQLDSVYHQIETELRSQYLLVYSAPPSPSGGGAFRRVAVEVLRPGLRAETMRGYYP